MNSRDFEFALNASVHAFHYFHSFIMEPYPLPHLQIILAPNFAAAAMENFGLITIRGEYVIVGEGASDDQKRRVAYVLSHEIAHQWFGNLVTAHDWSDVYLQEGLATLIGYRCVEQAYPTLHAVDFFYSTDVVEYYNYDVYSYSIPIKPSALSAQDAVNSFSAVSYTKVNLSRHAYP